MGSTLLDARHSACPTRRACVAPLLSLIAYLNVVKHTLGSVLHVLNEVGRTDECSSRGLLTARFVCSLVSLVGSARATANTEQCCAQGSEQRTYFGREREVERVYMWFLC